MRATTSCRKCGVYNCDTKRCTTFCPEQRLLPMYFSNKIASISLQAQSRYGSRVKISKNGNVLIVSAPLYNVKDVIGNGAVFVYEKDSCQKNWVFRQRLVQQVPNCSCCDDQKHANTELQPNMSEESYNFGQSVAISRDGSTIAVGAPLQGSNQTGAVYVYYRSKTKTYWCPISKLVAYKTDENDETTIDEQSGSGFGFSIDMDDLGDKIIVGSPWADMQGAVYVFVFRSSRRKKSSVCCRDPRRNKKYYFCEKIIPSGTGTFSDFGFSVSLAGEGSEIAIGSPNILSSSLTFPNFGSLSLYELDECGNYTLTQEITPEDASADILFGTNVKFTLNADFIFVEAPGADKSVGGQTIYENVGSVYVYKREKCNYRLLTTLCPDFSSVSEQFLKDSSVNEMSDFDVSDTGFVVAIGYQVVKGGVVVVFRFCCKTNTWKQGETLRSFDNNLRNESVCEECEFGTSVSLSGSGNDLVVGEISEDPDKHSAAYVFSQ